MDMVALGLEVAWEINERLSPFNKKEFSITHVQPLPHSSPSRVAARSEEYCITFPDYLDKKSSSAWLNKGCSSITTTLTSRLS